jgi:hypothetical protein
VLTEAEIKTAFDDEAGDASVLATLAQVRGWFNQGQSRLDRKKLARLAFTWNAAAAAPATGPVAATILQLEDLRYDAGKTRQPWALIPTLGLRILEPDVTTAAGSGVLYYRTDWADLIGGGASEMPRIGDTACIYYALHRFFRRVGSNRAQYKRYATLLGANAISEGDLQQMSESYFNDFLTTQADWPLEPPASFYGS